MVDDRHLVTCAHVVAVDASGADAPVDEIKFDFPLVAAVACGPRGGSRYGSTAAS